MQQAVLHILMEEIVQSDTQPEVRGKFYLAVTGHKRSN